MFFLSTCEFFSYLCTPNINNMKHTFRTIVVAAMAVVVVTLAGCGKEDGNNDSENVANNGGSNGGGGNTTVEWVDLGLPSGLLWASCNVGATAPEEYGDYIAWGETMPKDTYNWNTYRYCTLDDEGRVSILTKYNTINYYGTIDNLTTLQPVDDAATIRIGDGARTPTKEEWQELIDNTSIGTTTINGVSGRIFTASNGNSIFMPSAGSCLGSSPYAAGNLGSYWTASISTETPASAWLYEFRPSGRSMEHRDRVNGNSVRAVHDKLDPNPQPNPQPVPEGWVDLALPSGLLWAECNVGAMAPEQDGYYYSWGEIMPKDYYDWYHYAYGDEHQLTKYCDNPAYGLHGFFDTLTILEPDDDAATANMGNGARTPTYGDWSELISNTTSEWTTHNGKYGRRFTGSNGSTLFLPAAGVYFFTDLDDAGSSGYYWSSSLYVGHNFPENAYAFGFSYYSQGMDPTKRDLGLPVRAVRAR